MSIKIVLNGAGRIGKSILKQLLNDERFEIVAINVQYIINTYKLRKRK